MFLDDRPNVVRAENIIAGPLNRFNEHQLQYNNACVYFTYERSTARSHSMRMRNKDTDITRPFYCNST